MPTRCATPLRFERAQAFLWSQAQAECPQPEGAQRCAAQTVSINKLEGRKLHAAEQTTANRGSHCSSASAISFLLRATAAYVSPSAARRPKPDGLDAAAAGSDALGRPRAAGLASLAPPLFPCRPGHVRSGHGRRPVGARRFMPFYKAWPGCESVWKGVCSVLRRGDDDGRGEQCPADAACWAGACTRCALAWACAKQACAALCGDRSSGTCAVSSRNRSPFVPPIACGRCRSAPSLSLRSSWRRSSVVSMQAVTTVEI